MRLIDADALEKAIYEWMPKDQETWMESDIPPIENLIVSIMMTIEEQPTVDAVPVRPAKWLKGNMPTYGGYKCSICGNNSISKFSYCPNCGAHMKEK